MYFQFSNLKRLNSMQDNINFNDRIISLEEKSKPTVFLNTFCKGYLSYQKNKTDGRASHAPFQPTTARTHVRKCTVKILLQKILVFHLLWNVFCVKQHAPNTQFVKMFSFTNVYFYNNNINGYKLVPICLFSFRRIFFHKER